MMTLDEKKIATIKRGEVFGYLFIGVAVIGLIFFGVCYPIARVKDLHTLLLLSYIVAPVLVAVGAGGAAFCNLKFGGDCDRMIRKYIIETCLKNPQAMHPERDSLTFYIELDGCVFTMHANAYKENLTFDFSAFKKLSLMRRAAIANEICNRVIISFCRLYERGANYKQVNYTVKNGSKKTKFVPVIVDGVPDKKSFKIYLKNKN